VKHLSGALLMGRFLSLLTSIRLGWKELAGTNTLAYLKKLQITPIKSFITLDASVNLIKLFSLSFTPISVINLKF
jgi:hypothetical protein